MLLATTGIATDAIAVAIAIGSNIATAGVVATSARYSRYILPYCWGEQTELIARSH